MYKRSYKFVEKLDWRLERVSKERLRFIQVSGTCRGASSDERSLSAVRQANWVPTVAPGNRWIQWEWIQCSHPASWLAVAHERRLSCARRIGISKHPIVLSVSRSRVHHLFFRGICQGALPILLARQGATMPLDDDIWIAKTFPLRWSPKSNNWYHGSGHRQVRRSNGDV